VSRGAWLVVATLGLGCASGKSNAVTSSSADATSTSTMTSTTTTTSTSTTSGTGGAGGGSGCTPISVGAKVDSDIEPGGSSLVFEVKGFAGSEQHVLFLEFFDGAGPQKAGSFTLGKAPDDNYGTCAHCVLVYEDFSAAAPTAYFPTAGTLTVTTPDIGFTGSSAGSLKSIELHEVTVKGGMSTPVVPGKCVAIAAASWNTTGQ
jgi:hypothetical protein